MLEMASAEGEILGITNAGALAGVLVPMNQRTVQRMADRDAPDLQASVQRAREEMAAAEHLDTPPDVSFEDTRGEMRPDFTRISIRELSGTRIEQASAAGETLLVTKDRVVLGVLVPVTQDWVDHLIENSVARFLGEAADPETAAAPGPFAPQPETFFPSNPEMTPTPGWESLRKRALGIKIITDAPGDRERLVGVVTDILGSVIGDPVEMSLPDVSEQQVFAKILTLVDVLRSRLSPEEYILGLGLEIGGHVHEGRVVYSANANWEHFPLADRLADALNVPVILENDANALAVYERWFRGIDDDRFAVVLITHLGVGCGLVLDGRVYRGIHGMAGELGHIPVDLSERTRPKCRCENPGCLEGVATPHAIGLTLSDHGFYQGYDAALLAPDDDTVRKVFGLAGAAMGRALANIINILNPSAIVLHGPRSLLGLPGQFRSDGEPPASGVARHYVAEMLSSVREHSFSTGADDCRFIVRTSDEEKGAAAAATCLIRHVEHPQAPETTEHRARAKTEPR